MDTKIKIDLNKIAFDIFRDFITSVNEYDPSINITINDETLIVNDLISTINKAKKALKAAQKEGHKDKFKIGFMLGFINSNLNSKWTYEYVIKQSNEYKEFIAIKAISLFLKQDTLNQIIVNDLYNKLILSENNFLEIDTNIEKKTIGNEKLDNLVEPPKNNVLQMLENKINEYIIEYLNNDKPVYVWPIVKYFSSNGILQLINTEVNKL